MGIGITETLCISVKSGYMKNYSAKTLLRNYRNNFAKSADFDSLSFEDGVQIAFDNLSCRLWRYLKWFIKKKKYIFWIKQQENI